MAKILKNGNTGFKHFVGKIKKCVSCGCKFKIEKKDLKKIKVESDDRGSVGGVDYTVIPCPECRSWVDLN